MKCTIKVSFRGGPLIDCGKVARWFVDGQPRCNRHARASNYSVKDLGRVPIKAATK